MVGLTDTTARGVAVPRFARPSLAHKLRSSTPGTRSASAARGGANIKLDRSMLAKRPLARHCAFFTKKRLDDTFAGITAMAKQGCHGATADAYGRLLLGGVGFQRADLAFAVRADASPSINTGTIKQTEIIAQIRASVWMNPDEKHHCQTDEQAG